VLNVIETKKITGSSGRNTNGLNYVSRVTMVDPSCSICYLIARDQIFLFLEFIVFLKILKDHLISCANIFIFLLCWIIFQKSEK
jgi:hypothetical protein